MSLAQSIAHQSALRSIARVVEETVTPTDPAVALPEIAGQLRSGGVLVITGAGVSTDSGIPDYRGPNGSLTRHRPMTYQEFKHDPAALQRYWARSFVGWRHMAAARPNRTHFALSELEQSGFVSGVITQNVDGLHMAAGSKNVLALHGSLADVVCLNCGNLEDRRSLDQRMASANPRFAPAYDQSQVNPDGDVALSDADVAQFHLVGCLSCGSTLLKPNVVYFGEPVPAERKAQAKEMLLAAKSVLAVGTSLAVMSGLRLVLDAEKQGKVVSVINGGPGRADPRAKVVWRTAVGPAFDALLDELDI
ncbi:Sir2 family NAD-dependent protein deacetylase [Corynebacterium epidermidicanis]|uniref:protein acetyllysine N-acetyltransferase n=1 Tax=Corynebacterium epidermidicanis TaxID=1050174 RepID=A0A0G3GMJ4_9CORY|nr:Sir2 family NAD-dependent protein deacetylase [Corynebacterium epidermidicanis]AKK02451.1 NAD-dependent protein deacetylase, SIR2 family [Corynebacterium epidermidicanis]